MPATGDEAFCAGAAGALASLPGVIAVALGDSRASGTARPDSAVTRVERRRGRAGGPR